MDITADRAIRGTCFGKCILNKLSLMKDNNVDMDGVRNYFNTKFSSDPEYAKEMINAFDHCHGKSEYQLQGKDQDDRLGISQARTTPPSFCRSPSSSRCPSNSVNPSPVWF